MELVTTRRLDGDLRELAWTLYLESFDALRTQAVQRHLMHRDEFDAVMDDPRVHKLLVLDHRAADGPALAGMGTVTDDLAAVPLISPDYFAQHWPRQYRARSIWYVGFLAVAPAYQGGGAASHLVRGVTENVSATGGLVAIDVCSHNETTIRLPTLLLRLGRTWAPGATLKRLDSQTYWAFDVPEPVEASSAA